MIVGRSLLHRLATYRFFEPGRSSPRNELVVSCFEQAEGNFFV